MSSTDQTNAGRGDGDYSSTDEMSAEEKRHDQLTTAPKSTERDADPRVEISESSDGPTRIDVRDDAIVRPGKTTGRGDLD